MKNKFNKLYIYLRNYLALKKTDVFLVSYPKSGNTWLRFYICNLINEQSQYHFTDGKVDFSILDNTMPEMGFSNLSLRWPFSGFPRIIKTHRKFSPIFGANKSILLIRDPRDVMVSYYNFEQKKNDPRFQGAFSEFIRNKDLGLEAWCKHFNSWKNRASYIIKYEALKENDIKALASLNDFLKLSIADEVFEKAVFSSRFENISKIEKKTGQSDPNKHRKDFKFARSGKTGQWHEYFSEVDYEYYNEVLKKYDIQSVFHS